MVPLIKHVNHSASLLVNFWLSALQPVPVLIRVGMSPTLTKLVVPHAPGRTGWEGCLGGAIHALVQVVLIPETPALRVAAVAVCERVKGG